MRKFVPLLAIFALMMTSCAAEPVITAEAAREKWPESASCSMRAEFDCGGSAAVYTLLVSEDGDATAITVETPESLAGLCAVVTGEDAEISYDGAVFGAPGFAEAASLPSPLATVPPVMRALRDGVVTLESAGKIGTTDCAVIDTAYNICGKPWVIRYFVAADGRPVRAEASFDGTRELAVDFLQWKGNENGYGDEE